MKSECDCLDVFNGDDQFMPGKRVSMLTLGSLNFERD